MGWGNNLTKAIGKINGVNNKRHKVFGVVSGPAVIGDSVVATKEASEQFIKQAQKKEVIRAAEEAALAEKQAIQKNFERKILGQRSQRIENAAQSRTDFTSEEDVDPRYDKVERLLAKKRKLIGFE